ncbi:MAG: hypothetical protein AAB455_03035 [Patescibacteria group bacterium]
MEIKNNRKNLFITTVIIFAILFTGYNVFKGDTTNDWPTYRNDKYGFEIKYPSGWEFYESTAEPIPGLEGPELKTFFIIFSEKEQGLGAPSLSTNTLEIFEEEKEKILDTLLNRDKSYTKVGDVNYSDLVMTKLISTIPADNKDTAYLFQDDKFTYIFHTYGVSDKLMLNSLVFQK